MDQTIKIMPCLDMQNGRVVKGVHFVDIRDAGDPVECARAYCENGADELALLDITATVEGRATMLDVVKRVAEVTTVPFTVGGGISSVEDVNLCYERAFELTDLTIADLKWQGSLKELLRFREYLAEQYHNEKKDLKINEQLSYGLVSLTPESFNMLH